MAKNVPKSMKSLNWYIQKQKPSPLQEYHNQIAENINQITEKILKTARRFKKKKFPGWCSSVDWVRTANQRVAGSIPRQDNAWVAG